MEYEELATEEFKKYLLGLKNNDAALSIEAIQNLKIIMSSVGTEAKLDELLYRGPVEYEGQSFCFTGIFNFGTRKECHSAVLDKGGLIEKDVNLRVDYLVLGSDFNPNWAGTNYGRKIERAMEIKKGEGKSAKPLVLSESDWVRSLNQ
jgi:NAD-dependent DNA ligase